MNEIILALEIAMKKFPKAIIFGAILYPETPDNPEEVQVFGGCSSESWDKALSDESCRGYNYHKLYLHRVGEKGGD